MTKASYLCQGEAKEPVVQVGFRRLWQVDHDLRDRFG
jgi:hypothetical protein